MIKIFKAGVLECWRIVEDPGFFRGSIETIVLKFQKVLLGPSLQYSITPIINNVIWATDDPMDKETQFKAVHTINLGGSKQAIWCILLLPKRKFIDA